MPRVETFLDPVVISQIQEMPLRAKTVVEGFLAGLHRSPFKGYSVEFAEYRPYMPGDDPKTIDWKVYARTDRYYVKEFEEETNLNCYILLDVSGSMAYGSRGYSKLQYASTLAASLAWLTIQQRDSVGFAAFDSSVREYLPARGTRGHLNSILMALQRLEARGTTEFQAPLDHLAEIVKRRGMIVVISDFLENTEPILRAVRHLHFKRHDILAFHVLDRAEVEFPFEDLTQFEDMETGERVLLSPAEYRKVYLQRLKQYLDTLRVQMESEAVDYSLMTTSVPLEHALFTFLAERRVRT